MRTVECLKQEVLAKPLPDGCPIRLVAIDGHGGAGKSTIARQLAEVLGAEIVHTDDFASWDNTLDWWPRLIADVLEPIRHGAQTLSYERGRWSATHLPEPVVGQPVTDVMILEGVSSARREFRPYLTYAVWVDTSKELCLQRGLERDGEERAPDWAKWFADEDAYIARDDPAGFADTIVDGSGGQT